MPGSFKEKVFTAVKSIPAGQIRTYGEIARIAGNPKAGRAVGNILNKNYNGAIPCHRVIRAGGYIGGYNRGTDKKIKILNAEGIIFNNYGQISNQ